MDLALLTLDPLHANLPAWAVAAAETAGKASYIDHYLRQLEWPDSDVFRSDLTSFRSAFPGKLAERTPSDVKRLRTTD